MDAAIRQRETSYIFIQQAKVFQFIRVNKAVQVHLCMYIYICIFPVGYFDLAEYETERNISNLHSDNHAAPSAGGPPPSAGMRCVVNRRIWFIAECKSKPACVESMAERKRVKRVRWYKARRWLFMRIKPDVFHSVPKRLTCVNQIVNTRSHLHHLLLELLYDSPIS